MLDSYEALLDSPSGRSPLDPGVPHLLDQLARLNANLERDIATRKCWKLTLRNGFIAAVGGAIGTTVALSLVVQFLQPCVSAVNSVLPPAITRQSSPR